MTTTAVTADPTDAQIDALKNRWVPWLRTQYPQTLDVVGHRDVNPLCDNPTGTICPGPKLYPLVQAGFFDTPGEVEDDMPTADEVADAVWKHPLRHPTAGSPPTPAETFMFYILRNCGDLFEGDAPSSVALNERLTNIAIQIGLVDEEVIKRVRAEIPAIVDAIVLGIKDELPGVAPEMVATIAKATCDEFARRVAA